MPAELISTDDARWRSFLACSAHDVYHLPEYAEVCARQEVGTPCALYAQHAGAWMLMPLIIRKLPPELDPTGRLCDAASPYGYPGPLLAGDRTQAASLLAMCHEAALEHGIVSVFIRNHPLLDSLPAQVSQGSRVVQGQTVYLDLRNPETDIEHGIRKSHRREIRALRDAGFQAEADDWELLPDFVRIYKATMTRLDAPDLYRFSENYFTDLRHALGPHLHLISVLSPRADLAAAGLFTTRAGIMQYHLSGSHGDYRQWAPTKLMLDYAWRWAKQNRVSLLHLGGGVGGAADSLFHFKAGFAPQRAQFTTLRLISNARVYEELVRRSSAGRQPPTGQSYFPAYRRPGDRRQETGGRRRRQEAGDRRRETGDRRQETEVRRGETGGRRQE